MTAQIIPFPKKHKTLLDEEERRYAQASYEALGKLLEPIATLPENATAHEVMALAGPALNFMDRARRLDLPRYPKQDAILTTFLALQARLARKAN